MYNSVLYNWFTSIHFYISLENSLFTSKYCNVGDYLQLLWRRLSLSLSPSLRTVRGNDPSLSPTPRDNPVMNRMFFRALLTTRCRKLRRLKSGGYDTREHKSHRVFHLKTKTRNLYFYPFVNSFVRFNNEFNKSFLKISIILKEHWVLSRKRHMTRSHLQLFLIFKNPDFTNM